MKSYIHNHNTTNLSGNCDNQYINIKFIIILLYDNVISDLVFISKVNKPLTDQGPEEGNKDIFNKNLLNL